MVKTSRKECQAKSQSLVIVVEGAGMERDLSTECRRAFSKLIKALGVKNMPSIVCGGGRSQAFDKFKTFALQSIPVLLLIDSEDWVAASASPWQFLHNSNVNWQWLADEKDNDCHFMVSCMENWLIASANALSIGSKNTKIAATTTQVDDPERVSKSTCFDLLNKAYKAAGQREYSKGDHSFALLEKVDPNVLRASCPWAKRFFAEVLTRCGLKENK